MKPPVFKHITVVNVDSPGKRKRMDEPGEAMEMENDFQPAGSSSYATIAKINGKLVGINRLGQKDNNLPKGRKPSIMYGTYKTGKDDAEELLAADVGLVASGVSRDASKEQFKDFIIGKGMYFFDIEKLTKDDAETRTKTFKVVVKLSNYEKAMKPENWPYRVGMRHYKPQRRNGQGMYWQQQSQQ